MAFNSHDDARFAAMIHDDHILSSTNSLSNIGPSALNFAANCWNHQEENVTEWSYLKYIANAVAAVLPSRTAPFDRIDLIEYWRGLTDLPGMHVVLRTAACACYASADVSSLNMDFAVNCSATAYFWVCEIYSTGSTGS